MRWDAVWINARIFTANPQAADAAGRRMQDAAIAVADGRIAWMGSMEELAQHPQAAMTPQHDVQGAWITPGLIDCHTHLVYAGNRASEFEMRLAGASYTEIAQAGGGILSTVRATRAASEQELLEQAGQRLRNLLAEGVTTIEIKSGYGLDRENELKMLRVARRLGELYPVTVRTTFLAAHALPPEFSGRADDYITHICEEMLPAAVDAGLVDAVDGFCEHIGFSAAQMRRVFEVAQRYDLPVKLHAEQLSNQRGAELVAGFGGLSADHIEYLDETGVQAMAQAGTVGVLLPVAYYFLRETQQPPIEVLRQYGVRLAVASDSNPGTAPVESLLLALNMAATCFGLTVEEALLGVTAHAAAALGMRKGAGALDAGVLEVGKRADFAVWNISSPAELVYRMGAKPLHSRVYGGQVSSC